MGKTGNRVEDKLRESEKGATNLQHSLGQESCLLILVIPSVIIIGRAFLCRDLCQRKEENERIGYFITFACCALRFASDDEIELISRG